MKLFKVKKGTPCKVRCKDEPFWRDWSTSHENVFSLEQIVEDPLKDYQIYCDEFVNTLLGIRDFKYVFSEGQWEIKLNYDDVEVLA